MTEDQTDADLITVAWELGEIRGRLNAIAHDVHWGLFVVWTLLALILWRVW